MDIKEIFGFIKKYNFFPSKKLGQNFLISDFYIKKITNLVDEYKGQIIEIGPGLGSLTSVLIQKHPSLIAIEFDKRLFAFLKEKYFDLKIYNDDVLKFDFNKILKDNKNLLISNLPYSISSQVIYKCIEYKKIYEMVFMLQKEVADKLLLYTKNNKINYFTIFINMIFDVKKHFDIPKNVFHPVPSVDSTILSFEKKEIYFDIQKMKSFLKKCFFSKRKTLINNLKETIKQEKIISFLSKNGLNVNVRPEDLSINNYLDLYKHTYEH